MSEFRRRLLSAAKRGNEEVLLEISDLSGKAQDDTFEIEGYGYKKGRSFRLELKDMVFPNRGFKLIFSIGYFWNNQNFVTFDVLNKNLVQMFLVLDKDDTNGRQLIWDDKTHYDLTLTFESKSWENHILSGTIAYQLWSNGNLFIDYPPLEKEVVIQDTLNILTVNLSKTATIGNIKFIAM